MEDVDRLRQIRGYKILVMAFVANLVVTGIGFYGFGVFFKPLADYFGRGRAGVGLGVGLSLIVGAIWAPRVGRDVDKWGPKPLLIGGSLMAALGLALMSQMTALWEYLILYGVLFSLANLHMGDIVTGSSVARHFPWSAGRALGIVERTQSAELEPPRSASATPGRIRVRRVTT